MSEEAPVPDSEPKPKRKDHNGPNRGQFGDREHRPLGGRPSKLDYLAKTRLWKYKPQRHQHCNQLGFHKSTAQIRLAIGGNGSSKTTVTIAELTAYILGSPYPHWFSRQGVLLANGQKATRQPTPDNPLTVWIITQKLPKNIRGSAPMAKLWYGENGTLPDGGVAWFGPFIPKDKQKKEDHKNLLFDVYAPGYTSADGKDAPMGARIEIRSGEQDIDSFEGSRPDAILIDEPIDSELFNSLLGRLLRAPDCFMVLGLTPYGDNGEFLDQILNSEDKAYCESFTFHSDANRYQDKATLEKASSLMSDELKATRLYGVPRSHIGIVYPDVFCWKHEGAMPGNTGNFVQPFEVPKHWTRYIIHDPGGRKPACWVFFAVDPAGDIYAYRCYLIRSGSNDLRAQVEYVRAMIEPGEWIERWYIDPIAGTRKHVSMENGVAERTIIEMYRHHGINFQLGPVKMTQIGRRARVVRMLQWLDPNENMVPNFWIMDKLPEFAEAKRQLRLYKWQDGGKLDMQRSKRETTLKKNDDFAYCIETAVAIPLRYIPRDRHTEMKIPTASEVLRAGYKEFWESPGSLDRNGNDLT